MFLPLQTARERLEVAGSQGGLCRSLVHTSVAEGYRGLGGKRSLPGERVGVAACRLPERLSNGIPPRSAEWCQLINGKWVKLSLSYCPVTVALAGCFVMPPNHFTPFFLDALTLSHLFPVVGRQASVQAAAGTGLPSQNKGCNCSSLAHVNCSFQSPSVPPFWKELPVLGESLLGGQCGQACCWVVP